MVLRDELALIGVNESATRLLEDLSFGQGVSEERFTEQHGKEVVEIQLVF